MLDRDVPWEKFCLFSSELGRLSQMYVIRTSDIARLWIQSVQRNSYRAGVASTMAMASPMAATRSENRARWPSTPPSEGIDVVLETAPVEDASEHQGNDGAQDDVEGRDPGRRIVSRVQMVMYTARHHC